MRVAIVGALLLASAGAVAQTQQPVAAMSARAAAAYAATLAAPQEHLHASASPPVEILCVHAAM